MTTAVGLVALKGEPGVVLVSDTMTSFQKVPIFGKSEAEYHGITTRVGKFFINRPQGKFAICRENVADCFNDEEMASHISFMGRLIRGEEDLSKFIENGRIPGFPQNKGSKYFPQDKRREYLIATRYGGVPKLYSVDSFGVLTERPVMASIGIGSEYALSSLDKTIKSGEQISIIDAINRAADVVREVERIDRDTTGLDMMIVMPDSFISNPCFFGKFNEQDMKIHKQYIKNIKGRVRARAELPKL